MVFQAVCCCPRHNEWKHGKLSGDQLRHCTRQETKILDLSANDPKNKGRKRQICISCRSRLEMEAKLRKLEDNYTKRCDEDTLSNGGVEDGDSPLIDTGDFIQDGDTPVQGEEREEVLRSFDKGELVTTSCDKGTQKPIVPLVPYKNMSERTQRNVRADIVDLLKDAAMKTVHFVPGDLTAFVNDLIENKKFRSTFGLPLYTGDIAENPTIKSLVKEYKSCVDKERKNEIRKRSSNQKSKICIGSSMNDSRVTLEGEKTPEHFQNRVAAANSIGRLTCYSDERRRLLSIVAMDYPYSVLQELFDCSSKTITAAKVHCILFGRGGTPPAKFKFTRQCVSPDILMELSEFFQRDNVSRPSSCRSVVTNNEETPIRYWKDSVKELINQYLFEFPNGVKRTYLYTHLPSNFRYNTMLAGLCNLCDEFGYSNYEKLMSFLANVERMTSVSMGDLKSKVRQHQRYMKTQFANQVQRHSSCLELCMNNAFGTCSQPHDRFCLDASSLFDVGKQLQELLCNVTSASEQESLKDELQSIMKVHTQYAAHLLRTKHQGDYYQYILKNLQPGEAVVIVDYKMKLELGLRTREVQRDWYGKRGISLHGFLVIAQVNETERRTEVIDLWSEDTKQDAWFSQSAMDIGFHWMEKEFPGFRVYLFSDNGPHYHNTAFILYLAEVSRAFDLTLVSYNNFEAGEGKSKLDTHFAHISHKIVRWVRVGNNLETGSQLGELIGSMKNVTCRKLVIDRSKAPDKLGTLKDISLFGSFEFPTAGPCSGGLVAQSLAGIGKEVKKNKQQLQALANRSNPIAGATGAVTTEEIPFSSVNTGNRNQSQEIYSVRFIQHEMDQQSSTASVEMTEPDPFKENLLKPGFGLKCGGAKRTVFSLEQKDVMLELYNRQANQGIRADARECIAIMRARGIEVLKESQIKSWWSTYHQKRKREMERMAADLQSLRGTPPSQVINPPMCFSASEQSSTSTSGTVLHITRNPATSSSPLASSTNHGTASTTSPPVTSNTLSASVAPAVSTSSSQLIHVGSLNFANDMDGTDVGCGITEWYFPWNISQSTIDGRNGSNACTFIALNFGNIYQQCHLIAPQQHLNQQWQAALEDAIRTGNDMHDELFDGAGINVAVDDAIDAAGNYCQVGGILHEHNVFGANPLDQFSAVIDLILHQKSSFHVLVANDMTMLLIVDCNGTLMFIDSHIHGNKGALIAQSVPYQGQQAHSFSAWFNQMLVQSHGVGLSICSLSTISYL